MSIPTVNLKIAQAYQVKGPHFKFAIWSGVFLVSVDKDGDPTYGKPVDQDGEYAVERMLI